MKIIITCEPTGDTRKIADDIIKALKPYVEGLVEVVFEEE